MEEEKPMKTIIVALLGLTLLAGCASQPQRIEISAKPIDKPQLVLPPVEQLRLKDVEWVVITEENAQEVFAKLLKDRKDPVLIGLTDDGYEQLSLNISDIMTLIAQQRQIIAAYQNYYEESEQALEEANNNIANAQSEVEAQNAQRSESILGNLNPFK
jgi:uncharacterized protein YcfL